MDNASVLLSKKVNKLRERLKAAQKVLKKNYKMWRRYGWKYDSPGRR